MINKLFNYISKLCNLRFYEVTKIGMEEEQLKGITHERGEK